MKRNMNTVKSSEQLIRENILLSSCIFKIQKPFNESFITENVMSFIMASVIVGLLFSSFWR